MRALAIVLRTLLLASALSSPICPGGAQKASAPRDPDIYARVDAKLAGDPALASRTGRAQPELADFAWMVGSWSVEAVTFARVGGAAPEDGTSMVQPVLGGTWLQVVDRYPSGTQDIGYITYNAATRRWVSIAIDSLGNSNSTYAEGWDSNRIEFEGDVTILGLPAHFRQTIIKVSDREYLATNEELINGSWRMLDQYRYRRVGTARGR